MTKKQTITKNPSGDLCQHGAYADLCITCWPTVKGWMQMMEKREQIERRNTKAVR